MKMVQTFAAQLENPNLYPSTQNQAYKRNVRFRKANLQEMYTIDKVFFFLQQDPINGKK